MSRYLYSFLVLLFCQKVILAQNASSGSSSCTENGCHKGLISLRYLHPPMEDDCMACHTGSSKDHPKNSGREFKLTEKVPQLCYQCHDFEESLTVIHAPVSEGSCTDCHNEHGSQNAKLLKHEFICDKCHEMDTNQNFVHGPVAGKMCTGCHEPHKSAHKALLKTTAKEICLYCHEEKKENQNFPSVHAPFLEDCMDCHKPHYSQAKYLLVQDVPEMCFICHEQVEVDLANKSEVHGPFQAGGKCYLCHNAHVSMYDHLLQDKEQTLCFSCHNKSLKKGDRKVKDIQSRVLDVKHVHAPVESDGCSVCHAAHTPDNYFLLSQAFPKGSYAEGQVENFAHCFDCHDKGLFTEATTTSATRFRDGNLNLHYIHVNREKARNCTTCHDTHGTEYPFLIASEVPFGKWAMPMKFTVFDDGGSCMTGCHKELGYHRNIP